MTNLNQTLKDYQGHKELTKAEKEIVKNEYNNCKKLNLVNFVDKITVDIIHKTNPNISTESIYSYLAEVKNKQSA